MDSVEQKTPLYTSLQAVSPSSGVKGCSPVCHPAGHLASWRWPHSSIFGVGAKVTPNAFSFEAGSMAWSLWRLFFVDFENPLMHFLKVSISNWNKKTCDFQPFKSLFTSVWVGLANATPPMTRCAFLWNSTSLCKKISWDSISSVNTDIWLHLIFYYHCKWACKEDTEYKCASSKRCGYFDNIVQSITLLK